MMFKHSLQLKKLALFLAVLVAIASSATSYTNGGSDWTGTCLTGTNQSPIDIPDVQGSCDNTMNLTLQLSNAAIATQIVKDTTLISNTPTGSYWSYLYASNLDGVISGYKSTQFLVHAPAENTLNGSQADVELQLIHSINTDFTQTTVITEAIMSTAIVSIMFSVNDSVTSTFFSSYDTSQAGSAASAASISLNLSTALSALNLSGEYYLYQGSQSAPPCTENANWYVYSQVLPITTAQLQIIQGYYKGDLQFAGGRGNNRSTQSLNGRTVKLGNIQCEEQFIHFFSFFVIYTFLNFFVCKML